MKNNKETAGFGFAILDMITYGLFPVFSHFFVSQMDPLLFGGLVTLIGSIPLLVRLQAHHTIKEVYAQKFLRSLLIIGFLNLIATILFFEGTKITSGLNTSLLTQLEPFYSIVLASIFLKEVITKKQFSATLLMVIGAVVVVYSKTTPLNLGDFLILITPIFYQVSHIFAKKIINKVADVSIIPASRLFYSGFLLTILAIIIKPSVLSELLIVQNWIAILFFAFIFRTLDQLLWYLAIARIPVSKASAVLPLAVAISFVGSVFILKEVPQMKHYVGLLLIFSGLLWLTILQMKTTTKVELEPEGN